MSYIRRDWESRNGLFRMVEKYHSERYMPTKLRIREKRRPCTGAGTPEWMQRINLRNAADNLSRLLMDNFGVADWYITFTCADSKHTSREDMEKAYASMMQNLRRQYKKRGIEFKYVAVLENVSGRGSKHGHILLPCGGIDFRAMTGILRKAWKLGTTYVKPYGGAALDARRMASYLMKEEQYKAGKENPYKKGQRSRIRTSKNLIRTEPKKRVVSAQTYREEIKPPKGYHIVKELTYTGQTADGYPYQHAVFEKDGT